MSDLDARLLAAHDRQDLADLVTLYHEAAGQAPNDRARGFYLTQSYVYALDINHPDSPILRAALVAMGREAP